MISHYYDEQSVRERVQSGQHREVVGGLWEEIGTLTFNYLATHGLTPRSRVLDVGCGCLRVGVHLVDFLEPGNYYGLDLSQALLEVGYDVELRHKDPSGNCRGRTYSVMLILTSVAFRDVGDSMSRLRNRSSPTFP